MFLVYSPNRACDVRVLTDLQRCLERSAGGRRSTLIRKNAYLVTLALVSPTRNRRSRAQTSIFTIENQHFLVQMAPEASWPPDVSAESLEARRSQPGVLSKASSARIPQPGVLSQDSSARNPQPAVSSQSVWGPRWSHFQTLDETCKKKMLLLVASKSR